MQNYEDKNMFFDYTNKTEWIQYIKNNIVPLWEYSYILKGFFEELKIEFNNRNFSEITEEYRPLLLGGFVQSDEEFRNNSLAKFYINYFGLDMNRNLWKMQESISEKVEEIKIDVTETEFIQFVKEVCSILEYGLDLQQLVSFSVPELNYEELLKGSSKLRDLITNFYKLALDIVINFNPKTFFLCSINQIPQHYIRKAYLHFPQILDIMRDEFGLIELSWDNPIDPETNIFQDYIIFCFPEFNPKNTGQSFGGSICNLNNLIWEKFSDSSNLRKIFEIIFLNVPNLKENYNHNISNQLPEEYNQSIYYNGIVASNNHNNIDESKTSLMEMIDENSPFLFVNWISIKDVGIRYSRNEITFREI